MFGVSMKERGSRLDEAVPLIHRLSTEIAWRLGDVWLGGPSPKLDELAACVRIYREAMRTARWPASRPTRRSH